MADKMTGEQVQVPCQHCGKDTAVSAFHSLLNMSTVYIAENRDLRAKLETAEAHGEQYRQNWLSLQDLTGEECLDRARYAVKAWKEAAEQLAAATALAEKAERERDVYASDLRREEVVTSELRKCVTGAITRAEAAEAERDHLARQNADLRAALEEIVGLNGSAAYLPPHEPTVGKAIGIARSALAFTPPDALDDLRRRERSIGAEEELRRIVYELVGSHSGPSRTTLTAGELDARADAIAAERDHFPGVGKMAERAGEGDAA